MLYDDDDDDVDKARTMETTHADEYATLKQKEHAQRQQSRQWDRPTVAVQPRRQTILLWPSNIVSIRSVDSGLRHASCRGQKQTTAAMPWERTRGTPVWLLCSYPWLCRLISASITRAMSTTFNRLTAASWQCGLRQPRLDRRLTGQIYTVISSQQPAAIENPAHHMIQPHPAWNRNGAEQYIYTASQTVLPFLLFASLKHPNQSALISDN